MVLHQLDPIPCSDNSTVCGANTPPESVASEVQDDHNQSSGAKPSSSSIPWPGSTFIIRSVSSGKVVTLLNGEVILAPPGGSGSIHWTCVETKGWRAFQNSTSGRFLGHNIRGRLVCDGGRHLGWENFCVTMTPEGHFVLLMTHWERLWYVGFSVENGVQKLAKIGERSSDAIVWDFIKV